MDFSSGDFIWDIDKETANIRKHGMSFTEAADAFADSGRKIFTDARHSATEPRYFCRGRVGGRAATVRSGYREGECRIFGAGYWRKGAYYYGKED